DGVTLVVDAITELLHEGPAAYDSSTLTDRSTAFFVKEYIREQALLSTRSEVPHAVAVSVEKFVEARHAVVIKATIHVEKAGQRIILIGKGGAKIKEIGPFARKRSRLSSDGRFTSSSSCASRRAGRTSRDNSLSSD